MPDLFTRSAAAMSARRPNLFIVGAPRCGTSSLHYYLSQHPDIYMSQPKEPHYFGRDLTKRDRRFPRTEEDYLALFRHAAGQRWRGEASTYYLYSASAPQEIYAFEPQARIIIALRHPVDFIQSLHARQLFVAHESEPSLERALMKEENRKRGQDLPWSIGLDEMIFYQSYVLRLPDQVKAYKQRFGSSQVKVILFSDFRASPLETYREVLDFLEVWNDFVPDLDPQNHDQVARSRILSYVYRTSGGKLKKIRRSLWGGAGPTRLGRWMKQVNAKKVERSPMSPELRARLTHQFAPVVEELSVVIDRDLSGWDA